MCRSLFRTLEPANRGVLDDPLGVRSHVGRDVGHFLFPEALRVDGSGGECIHRDATVGEVESRSPGHVDDSRTGRSRMDEERCAAFADLVVNDVDDRPIAARDEVGHEATHHVPRAVEVEVDDRPKAPVGDLGWSGGELSTGVVDEKVECPEFCDDVIAKGLDAFRVADVGNERGGSDADVDEVVERALEVVGIARGDRDGCPEGCKPEGGCATDTASSARHEDRATGKQSGSKSFGGGLRSARHAETVLKSTTVRAMRAVVCNEFGPLENLVVVDLPDPELRDGQVRLRVLASGVNYVDGLLVQGKYQIKPPVPFVPGMEVVGEVIERADDVGSVAIGSRVLANIGFGGFASHAVARADKLVEIPEAMSTGQAASFLQSYLTGWFAFTRRLGIDPLHASVNEGKWLLVLGAGGGVGLAAVDIGVALGYRVIGVASSAEKRALASSRGATHVIDSAAGDDAVKEEAKQISGGGVDVLYDPVGGSLAEVCLRALGEDGNYLVIGFVGGIPRLPANQVLLRNRRVTGVDWGAWAMRNPDENTRMLREVLSLIGEGRLSPVEPSAYPLSRAAQALGDLEARRVAGKVVLLPE